MLHHLVRTNLMSVRLQEFENRLRRKASLTINTSLNDM